MQVVTCVITHPQVIGAAAIGISTTEHGAVEIAARKLDVNVRDSSTQEEVEAQVQGEDGNFWIEYESASL